MILQMKLWLFCLNNNSANEFVVILFKMLSAGETDSLFKMMIVLVKWCIIFSFLMKY